MTKFPNQEGLNKALNIYRSAMRSFIVCCLEKVHSKGVEELIVDSLNNKAANKFEQDLHLYKGNIEASIHINTFPHIIRNRWEDIFEQQFNPYSNVRNVISLIVDGRNQCAHLDTEDLDLNYTWTYLFLISDVLSQINRPDAKREIQTILDELFPDDTDEHIVDMTRQLEAAKAEKTELEKQVKTTSDRLGEVEAEWIASEERLTGKSNLLESAEAENTELKKRLSETENRLKTVESESDERIKILSGQLKTVKVENTDLKERFKTIPDQSQVEKVERAAYQKGYRAASKELTAVKMERSELEDRLEDTSTRLEKVKEKLADCKKCLAQFEKKPLRPNPNTPDSVTFQGTVFTKHLNEYYVTGDDISQSFWHYWQSQGREGKQEMRDAGWSIEKVDGEWEVVVSPEDFRAWIEYEITKLNNLFNFPQNEEPSTQLTRPSYERTSLPTVKEMVQPALEVFADRKEHRRVEMINHLTEYFLLDDDERHYLSKTGQVEKHLMNEGLIERTRTGYYRITDRGYKVVEIPF